MKRDWWNREFRTLVTLGESTTAGGWASCRERSWPEVLARLINDFQRVPVQLINMGIGANLLTGKNPGYRAEDGNPPATKRLDQHAIAHRPDLLLISYGLNDARGGISIELFCNELRSIIERVRAELQPLIALMGPYYMTDFTVGGERWGHADVLTFYRFNEAIEAVARETDCLFVNLLESYRDADWLVHRDGVHANDVGHRLVAHKVFEVLASNCSGLALETKALEDQIPPWREDARLRELRE